MSDSHLSFVLVDGNNIIYAWPELLEVYSRSKESARNRLIQLLEGFQDFSNERVVVVFDGRGKGRTEVRDPLSIQVIYSGGDASADSIIERLALSNCRTYRITVASNDVSVQDAVVAAGGEAISAEALADRVEQSRNDMDRWLNGRRGK